MPRTEPVVRKPDWIGAAAQLSAGTGAWVRSQFIAPADVEHCDPSGEVKRQTVQKTPSRREASNVRSSVKSFVDRYIMASFEPAHDFICVNSGDACRKAVQRYDESVGRVEQGSQRGRDLGR